MLQEFENNWGVKIEENGIDLRDVVLPDDYQKAAGAGKRLELEADGVASQTVGMIVASMAKSRGKTMAEIQAIINQDPQLQKQFMDTAKDLLERKMAIEKGALVDVRVGGAEGLEKMILSLLAAGKKIGGGSNNP
ncbi:MAG: hypothetical protein NT148_00050 [Candidatus Nealsonbacteria bacterium]|nr:hypothetical protein [Candidatus Nealsonbacteria bacterium]